MTDTPGISPLAPDYFPTLPEIKGVRLGVAAAGVKYRDRTDVLLVEMLPETNVAGVFTQSKTASAPVDWCKKSLNGGSAQGLLVNSGNANAFTGARGVDAVEKSVEAVADILACRPSRVFAASTGVIGEPLDWTKITSCLENLYGDMTPVAGPDDWQSAARAIMTTDTFAKAATKTVMINGVSVTINGIAKGSGMIAPDMATMLSFIFTDAAISSTVLQEILSPLADQSFNAITVDSDTSTSDTVLLFATNQAGHEAILSSDDPCLDEFKTGLKELMINLAQQIVRDGEGATKFISITVTGAECDKAAKNIALSIANSPLVKTAIAGEDANWGRIVMAVGKAGEAANRDKLSIQIGGVAVADQGLRVENYDETPIAKHMKGDAIEIIVDVGVTDDENAGRATVWTCDLTHGYITINADYRS